MWASPPTRIMKLQQDGASRTPPPTKFYHSSVRRSGHPCPPAKFVPSTMQKPCHCEGSAHTGRGERTERCQWQMKRSEPVAAVKISSVRRKAAWKFWAPQQGHPYPRSQSPLGKGGFFCAKKEDASRHPLFCTIESLENYFSSTLAPTSSSCFFMFSASSLDRASFRVVGVSSTAFLASARPRPVISRTDLMTLIF